MKRFVRWEDWATLVIGAVIALSPLWLTTTSKATGSMIVLGILVAAVGLVNLVAPDVMALEWTGIVLGALLFLSPWIMNFHGLKAASWTAWIAGALVVLLSVAALPSSVKAHRGHGVAA
ncbi:SPW repeat-containing protein [Nakamurella panacisegetis]|uniref:SPW repeat-containing protein n=1 Tax=Nakamurella panacisegetis TaxID=1090615 RepID=A0A1H0PNA5_9ACTN|nr:SPW repeat protein [Nakamurella panacisegetis]SDP06513.1 SPW repeat-containing protein [Nakamurella panacisegetis]